MAFDRNYQPYIESGEIGLDLNFARGVIQGTTDILSSYFGFEISQFRTVTLPQSRTPHNVLDPYTVNLGTFPHRILLTRRGLIHPRQERRGRIGLMAAGVCLHPIGSYDDTLSIVSIPSTSYESDLDTAVATLTHEIVHSVGVEKHCVLRNCLMFAAHDGKALENFSLSQNPFCLEHEQRLEALNTSAVA